MNWTVIKDSSHQFYNKLLEVNFYTKPNDDVGATQKGRLATRLYIVVFICAIIVLTFYSSLRYSTETITISQPTLNNYLSLEKTIKQSLTCLCTNIAISQSSFISLTPEYHQLCSSDFLSDVWFDYLTFVQNTALSGVSSWNWGILPKFRFLQAMCQLAESTAQAAIDGFGQSKFVTATALTVDEFNSQTSAITNTLIQNTATSFVRAINLIIISKRYEQLSNMFGTNSYITYSNGYIYVYASKYNNGNCSCSDDFTCSQQIMLKQNKTLIPVPGWYIGCYMIDSLLDSTLECYYNETCINLIYDSFPTVDFDNNQWNVSRPRAQPMNGSLALLSRFPVNMTVQDCLYQLFVDKWNPSTNFTSYYQECQPKECTYMANIRKDLLVVVTTLVGLLGGLSAALNLMAPITVRLLYDMVPEYWGYIRNKVGLTRRISRNRVWVIAQ